MVHTQPLSSLFLTRSAAFGTGSSLFPTRPESLPAKAILMSSMKPRWATTCLAFRSREVFLTAFRQDCAVFSRRTRKSYKPWPGDLAGRPAGNEVGLSPLPDSKLTACHLEGDPLRRFTSKARNSGHGRKGAHLTSPVLDASPFRTYLHNPTGPLPLCLVNRARTESRFLKCLQ